MGVLQDHIAVAILHGVFALGLDISTHRLEGETFVSPDAAGEQLILAGLGIEEPPAILLQEGNREGPGVVAYFEHALGIRLADDPVGLVERRDELVQVIGGLNPIRVLQILRRGAEDNTEGVGVLGRSGSHQRGDRLFRRGVGLASFCRPADEWRADDQCEGQVAPAGRKSERTL